MAKKKEEFDASLMGGYLPGANTPVSMTPVASVPQVMRDLYRWQYSTLQMTKGEELSYDIQGAALAWHYYAFGAGPAQIALQTPQAYGAYRMGVYPTFRMALIFELGIATSGLATLHTILDPHRVWRAPYTEKLDPQFIDPQFIPEGMTHGGYI